MDSVKIGRLIFSFYYLITNYSRIIQNSELENLEQDHRHYQGVGLSPLDTQRYNRGFDTSQGA